jgi:hypothetical protein
VTFVHQRSYRYNTVAADMFEPLETVRDHTPSGGVIGVQAIDAMNGTGILTAIGGPAARP